MGREIVRPGGPADLDQLAIAVDVRGLGLSGFQVADWMRAAYHVDLASADQCRVSARLTHGDDDERERRLIEAFRQLVHDRDRIGWQPQVRLPAPDTLTLETVMLPRKAFFGPAEHIAVSDAVGRIAAEMASPYPPGVPVIAPGERITADVLDYLTSGPPAGMFIPDAADESLKTIRVVVPQHPE
jgi:arginine/lysine/ornithine decarboxylase